MSQILTPEEIASLLAGLREVADNHHSEMGVPPAELRSTGGNLADPGEIDGCRNFSNWLLALRDSRWLP